jgi:glycosyltransferase involved in cell wall biosynthesis
LKKLSIITINLNNASGLRKTVESVVSQTYRNIEYIVIDGGSTDDSLNIIKEYAGRITIWVSESDKGIFNALNKGIQKATGEYCLFLNSGDWLTNHSVVEKMMAALPECSFFYGNMLKMLPNGYFYRDCCDKGEISMLTFYLGTINIETTFIKRTLFRTYGLFDENLNIVSDWKFFLIAICLNSETVKYIDLDVTCFDMTGISNMKPELDKKERRKVLEALIPANILFDYDAHSRNIEQASRINRYKITRWVFWFLERILFKWEKFRLM